MISMLKVLHIVLGLQVGGLEKFVLDLVDNYSSDVKSFIICLEEKGELGLQHDGLTIIELSKEPGINLKIAWQLVTLINKYDIDIIHTHNPGPHFYGAIAGFFTHCPVVHTKHGRNYPTAWKKVLLNKISSFLTTKVVAVSANAEKVCLEVEKIPASKVMVILNGIDTNRFSFAEKEGGIEHRPVRIGIVARLSAEKDHQTLLNACKILAVQGARFHLEIIGDGILRGTLEKSVNTYGIDSYITFSGMRHDVPDRLRQLDIFVLSSTTEGVSLTLLEAMATGLPVVATDVGGNPEVVIDGETGYLVPMQNPAEMAGRLLLLLNDEKLRRHMGSKGRERVVNTFSIKETARKYVELYDSVAARG